ncbi:MAG: hypothetical protein ABI615_03380 [Chthoniobacterales bacterium]
MTHTPRNCLRRPVLFVIVLILLTQVTVLTSAVAGDFSCSFAKGAWKPDEWLFVKGPMPGTPSWIQREDSIENDGGSTNMLLKAPFKGNVTIRSTMAFQDKLAPLIIIASKIKDDGKGNNIYDGPYLEIVIWNKGVNVWRDGARRVAFYEFPMEKNVKYPLEVTKKGNEYTVNVAGHVFGFFDDSLKEDFYPGVSGCEGIDRIYDFSVTPVIPPPKTQ